MHITIVMIKNAFSIPGIACAAVAAAAAAAAAAARARRRGYSSSGGPGLPSSLVSRGCLVVGAAAVG